MSSVTHKASRKKLCAHYFLQLLFFLLDVPSRRPSLEDCKVVLSSDENSTQDDPFAGVFIWPKVNEKAIDSKPRRQEHVPSVTTSNRWRQWYNKKDEDRKKKEEEKFAKSEQRKQIRIEKENEKEKRKKIKEENKLRKEKLQQEKENNPPRGRKKKAL